MWFKRWNNRADGRKLSAHIVIFGFIGPPPRESSLQEVNAKIAGLSAGQVTTIGYGIPLFAWWTRGGYHVFDYVLI